MSLDWRQPLKPWEGLAWELAISGENSGMVRKGSKTRIPSCEERDAFHTWQHTIRTVSSSQAPFCPHWAHLERRKQMPSVEKGHTVMKSNFKDALARKAFELHHWQCFTDLFPICSYAEQTFWAVQQQFRLWVGVLRPTVRKYARMHGHRPRGTGLPRGITHKTASQESCRIILSHHFH